MPLENRLFFCFSKKEHIDKHARFVRVQCKARLFTFQKEDDKCLAKVSGATFHYAFSV